MASVLNLIARVLFIGAALVFLLALLAVGAVVGLVWWLVALLTGGRRPPARVWVSRMQQQAQDLRRRAPGGGEIIDADVREIR